MAPIDRLTVRVTVDGRVLDVERGTTILAAARQAGVDIPTLCWHPKVSILGACRICLVEVEGMNKLIASCQTPVGDGMVVRTDTPAVHRVRQTMLELLLAKHPLDCLACDKGGWCDLQKLGYRYAPRVNRFRLPQEYYGITDRSPFVERDTRKCVLCRRCIRVCREVRGVNVWGAMYRGFDKKIATFFEEPLGSDFQDPFNCEFCGACVDICPVGALTSVVSKQRSRPWETASASTACPFCGVGCRLEAHHRRGRLVKTVPPATADGGFADLCFRGRFGTDFVNHPSRLTGCLLRQGEELVPVPEAEAVAFVAERLRGSGPAAAFVGAGATEGEALALASLVAAALPGSRATSLDSRGDVEEGPFPLYEEHRGISVDEVAGASRLLVVGQDLTPTHPVAGIAIRRAITAGAPMLLVDPHDTLLGRQASWWLRPPAAGTAQLLAAMGAAMTGGGVDGLPSLVREVPGLASPDWPGILEFLRAPGELTVVFQKVPGGLHPRVRAALAALLSALPGEWRLCYLPLDADGFGVPLMLAASGFGPWPEGGEIPGGNADVPAVLFLRADPVGEGLEPSRWRALRERSSLWAVFESHLTPTAALADVVFPVPLFTELEGSFLAAGGEKILARLAAPPPGVRAVQTLAAMLRGALGLPSADEAVAPARERGLAHLRRAVLSSARKPELSGGLSGAGEGYRLAIRFHRFPGHRLRLVGVRDLVGPWENLELNPEDAASLGLAEGDRVAVVVGGRRFPFPVVVTPRVPPGQPALPFDPAFAGVVALVNAAGAGLAGLSLPVNLEKE